MLTNDNAIKIVDFANENRVNGVLLHTVKNFILETLESLSNNGIDIEKQDGSKT